MQPIFIPYNEEAESLLKELETTDEVSKTLRKLQPYIVQVPHAGFNGLVTARVVQTVAPHRFEDQFWVLINSSIYHAEFGLFWDNPDFMDAELLVF